MRPSRLVRVAIVLKPSTLLRFHRDTARRDPELLVVAPMSGHFATLLRGTVDAHLEALGRELRGHVHGHLREPELGAADIERLGLDPSRLWLGVGAGFSEKPLTRMRNRAEEALASSGSEAEYRAALERTIEESDGLIRTFNALLMIARAESGQARGNMDDFDAADRALAPAQHQVPAVQQLAELRRSIGVHGTDQLRQRAQAPVVANWMTKKLKWKRVYIIDDQETYSQGLADGVQKILKEHGVAE